MDGSLSSIIWRKGYWVVNKNIYRGEKGILVGGFN